MSEQNAQDLLASYRVSSPYGQRNDPFTGAPTFHAGIDLVKSHQAPIYAFLPGKVVHAQMGVAGSGFGNYGNVVAVQDQYGALHCYCHLASIALKVGATVDSGDIVGRQGTTGRSTGSHLHYEVRIKSTPSYGYGYHTDPVRYLKQYIDKETEEMDELHKQISELQARVEHLESLQQHIADLENNASLPKPPEWAEEAVNAAVTAGVLKEPNGGSYDFYRILTIIHRKGLL
jgi:septal ring factor EnvC (AmiA/AmiB activator)